MLRTETAQARPGKADAETYWRREQQNSVCELHTEMQEEPNENTQATMCVSPAETKKETRP